MIAKLTGKLAYKGVDSLIIDVGGVGYQLFAPLSTFYKLPEVGDIASLYTYLNVREDALTLFGFQSIDEKNIFLKLISITGIGPKLALNILSGINAVELVSAIELQDVAKLTTIPGVGKKIGERIALELKDKMKDFEHSFGETKGSAVSEDVKIQEDVISALTNLGYKRIVAENALKSVLKENNEKNFEKLLRMALNILSRA